MNSGRYESHLKYGSQLLPFICRHDTVSANTVFSPHWHENIELLHCIGGEGVIIVNGESYPFIAGDIIAVNPNEIHFIGSDSTVSYDCLIIFEEFCKQNGIETNKSQIVTAINDTRCSKLHRDACAAFRSNTTMQITETRLKILTLLYTLYTHHSVPATHKSDNTMDAIKESIRFIIEYATTPLTLDNAAKKAHLSRFYFSKKFKQITGKSFTEFLNEQRCHHAIEYIQQNLTVAEAGFQAGFSDPAYFSRVFKKYIGISPSQYRQQVTITV